MIKIKKQLVSSIIINRSSYGYGNPVKAITIHQTGNTSKGANAQAHANLQSNGNSRSASWHYQVDDKQVIQSFPDAVKCWHASDGQGPGNTTSLSIEICINSDGDYKKAVENAAELTKLKLKEYGLSIKDVKQHHDWYNKNCPAQLRAGYKGITWNDFLNMVEGKEVSTKPAPKQKVKGTTTSNYKGKSLVDYLKSIKVDSSFNNRAKLAKQYGIKNYKGTATQNTQLLNAMRDGKKPSKPASKPKPSNSGKHGKLKIINVNSAAIIMDKPDRNSSKNLGTVKKGATLPLNGSVRGKNSSSGYWEVNFNGKLGYITGKYGKHV